MKLSDICRKTGISKRTIHYYIHEGLITPAIKESNGYYDFSEEDEKKLLLVRMLRDADISLADISSILSNPTTINFYLSRHITKLYADIRHSQKILTSLNYVLANASFHPTFDDVLELVSNSDIPSEHDKSVADAADHDYSLAAKYLWGGFLGNEVFTDYQEFLWEKLHRIAAERYSDDYDLVSNYLRSLDNAYIDTVFARTLDRYSYIAGLDDEGRKECALDMRTRLASFATDAELISLWKRDYRQCFEPITRIHASELGAIVAEISPFFASYRSNINEICESVYEWLISVDGRGSLDLLNATLGDYMNFEEYNHGQFEAITSLSISYA